MDSESSITKIVVIFGGTLILAAVVRAYVLSSLWNWFVTPAFNVPEMRIVTALGISGIASLFTAPARTNAEGKEKDNFVSVLIGYVVLGPLITLLLGWLVHALFV